MLTRAWAGRVRRHLRLPEPRGLVSIRYLWPGLTPAQRVHRRLLIESFPGTPRLLAAALNGWLWMRWSALFGWRAVFRTVRARAALVEAEWAVTRGAQLRAALWWALAHGVPPRDFYRFQLYRPERRARAWEYVYAVESDSFHRSRSGVGDDTREYELLQDKHRFAELMQGLGVPVVPTLAVVPGFGDVSTFERTIRAIGGDGVVFCKPRRGHGARGAVRAEIVAGEVRACGLDGRELGSGDLDRMFRADGGGADYLVQPYIGTHPALADLGSARAEAVTLRLITTSVGARVEPVFAHLEVPLRDRRRGYALVDIDVVSGEADGADHAVCYSTSAQHAELRRDVVDAAAGRTVPGWGNLLDHARRAHGEVPGLHSVAWDFIIGPYGPVLLEGNTNWGVAPLQIFHGPLLAEGTNR